MQSNNSYLNKQKLYQQLAKNTGLSKKTINLIFYELLHIIYEHMSEDGPEKFILPGFFKLTTKHMPPQEEKIGINPFTKEKMVFKSRPAYRKLKIKILKKLRDMVVNR